MSQVETVALWAGLIGSVISIVLSIVAIVFAILVDRSSRAVSQQTIKSLQKIETEVERLSNDTRELIKAGWDKLLCGFPGHEAAPSIAAATSPSVEEIAAGVAAELRADIASIAGKPGNEELNKAIESLQSTLMSQLSVEAAPDRTGVSVDELLRRIGQLGPAAKALTAEIQEKHITRQEYMQLLQGPLSNAIKELRKAGILMPVRAFDDEVAYYFPAAFSKKIPVALQLSDKPESDIFEAVRSEMKRVGYYSKHMADIGRDKGE